MPSPLLHPIDGQHSAFRPPVHLVTLHHVSGHSPITRRGPLCDARARRPGSRLALQPATLAKEPPKSGDLGTALHPPVHPLSHAGLPSTRLNTGVLECRSAYVAFGPRLPARSGHDPHSRVKAHCCTHTGAILPHPLHAGTIDREGYNRLRSVETTCPAKQHCKPQCSGEVYSQGHVR